MIVSNNLYVHNFYLIGNQILLIFLVTKLKNSANYITEIDRNRECVILMNYTQ